MAVNITGSKLPTYPKRPSPKLYRGANAATREGYGENGFTGPTSVDKIADSNRLSDIDANNEDAVRGALIAGGKPDTVADDQTRDVSDKLGHVTYGATRQTTPSRVGDVVVGTLPAASTDARGQHVPGRGAAVMAEARKR